MTYAHAVTSLLDVEDKIAKISIIAPDINFKNLEITKNFWTDLPADVATGISCMALHIDENYMSLLAYYLPNSRIEQHVHINEWEVIKILEGSAYDETNDVQLNKGDVYVIPKGKTHNIITKNNECYLYTLFTGDKKYLKIPHEESDNAKSYILDNIDIDRSEINVLYLDEDETSIYMFDSAFKKEGINIFFASTKEQYEEILKNNTIHVMLCDYHTKDMNGVETIINIHNNYPKIIVMTVTDIYDKNILDTLTKKVGVKTCHPKPWNNDVLLHSIIYSYTQYKKD